MLARAGKPGWRLTSVAYGRLSLDERRLVTAFDTSGVLLGGLEWIEWIYVDRRVFPDRAVIEGRLDASIARLAHLVAWH